MNHPERMPARELLSLLLILLVLCSPSAAAPPEPDAAALRRQLAQRKEREVRELLKAQATASENQDCWDVHYYDLDLDLDPEARRLAGVVTVIAEVTAGPISFVDLDLGEHMKVSRALVDGIETTVQRGGERVSVALDAPRSTGETFAVTIEYAGDPASRYFGWDTYDHKPMIWTLSQPYGARFWWPCKDRNTDKADSLSLRCTVPADLIAAGNGRLLSDEADGDRRTFHWKTNYPIAPYLVSLAVHPYHRYSHWYTPLDGGDPMEVQYFVFDDPAHLEYVETNYAQTVSMIETFAAGYGEYPFVDEKYGHADFLWGGGMEHQTITSLGGWSPGLIAHELAHQWWGDMVTCADFGDIWLNEGFATWSEAYWAEQQYGAEAYALAMESTRYLGDGTVYVEDPLHETIFDVNLSYHKGSWIVHMLRGVLGDEDFFAALAEYRSRHEYGSATTADLRDACETVSGRDLEAFFRQWVYGEYFPVYRYRWLPVEGREAIEVNVEQIQEQGGLFTMPLCLRIETGSETVDFVVENSEPSRTYTIPIRGEVRDVELDPDRWILCRTEKSVGYVPLHRGILLVNGVLWHSYPLELEAAYLDSAFTGGLEFSFWDTYAAPNAGYPSTLPEPLGHGPVPGDVIGDYSTIIWVGNNEFAWESTPVLPYLEAGGNVLLMTHEGAARLGPQLSAYLGVTWAETEAMLIHCLAAIPELEDIPFVGTQSANDVYLAAVDPGSLLLRTEWGFGEPRGMGAWVAPDSGGTCRADGGRLVHLGGRPYRMESGALRRNVDFLLRNLLLEPYTPPQTEEPFLPAAATVVLGRGCPNPFNPETVIPFYLPRGTKVQVAVYDPRGHRIRYLLDEFRPAGDHEAMWNGRDDAGREVASGAYRVRLRTAEGVVRTGGLVLVR